MNDLFSLPEYHIHKPIRLIELFAGVGSQSMALKMLGVEFEHYKVCEFDKYAIQSYNAIHNTNFQTSDITKIKGQDLEIVDTNKYEYILTYSFCCFTGDTLVLTNKGLKQIKNVQKGDLVLTHTNEYKKVIASRQTGNKNIFKIKALGVHSLKCTENHQFYVREMYRTYPTYKNGKRGSIRKFKLPQWKECKNLTNKDYLGIAINQNSIMPKWEGITFHWSDGRKDRYKNELSSLFTNHSFWWIIGRYIGDGWQRTQGGIIICCAKNENLEIEIHLRNCGFNYSIIEERTTKTIHIPLKELQLFVKNFGNSAINKKIPDFMFDMPTQYLQSFIEGYLSADGYVKSNLYKLSSISKELIYGTAQLVAKVYKQPYKIYKTERKKSVVIEDRVCNQHDTYELVWKTNKCKQDKAFYENGYIWTPIKEITDTQINEDVFDIEVEDNHSFTANGIIVHNCQDLSLAGKQKGMKKGSGTRSGLLWEVERLLNECDELPQVLVMENVTEVHSAKNIEDFILWLKFLESKGYTNNLFDLNAKDYGTAQSRLRCFMVSVLGEFSVEKPKKIELKKRVVDYLQEEVDEKYYLKSEKADKLIEYLKEKGKIPTHKQTTNNKQQTTNNKQQTTNNKQQTTKIVNGVDLCVKSRIVEVANGICARYDSGIKRHQCENTGVIEISLFNELHKS